MIYLIVTHGSRVQETNDLFLSIEKEFNDDTIFCFSEFGTPLIDDVVNDLLKKKVTNITIIPYFLFEGTHTKRLLKYKEMSNDITSIIVKEAFNYDEYLIESLKSKILKRD